MMTVTANTAWAARWEADSRRLYRPSIRRRIVVYATAFALGAVAALWSQWRAL